MKFLATSMREPSVLKDPKLLLQEENSTKAFEMRRIDKNIRTRFEIGRAAPDFDISTNSSDLDSANVFAMRVQNCKKNSTLI
jgi:hypothetical protein